MRLPLLALGLCLSLSACGGGQATSAAPAAPPTATGPASPSLSGTVTVFAASSLTGTFTDLGKTFEQANPGVDVVLSFGASSTLAEQVVAGAPVDVFAAASSATMRTVTDAGDAAAPVVFARNRLAIAVPPANPGRVSGLADFTRPALKIALCAPRVPCGAAAQKAFAAAKLTPSVDTEEQNVKAALAKVALGEVDAALVYRTDVQAAGAKVRGIDFPESASAVNDYPIATTTGARNPAAAAAFVAYVRSPQGQAVLAAAGFERP